MNSFCRLCNDNTGRNAGMTPVPAGIVFYASERF